MNNLQIEYDSDSDVEIIIGNWESDSDDKVEVVHANMYTQMCKNVLDNGDCERVKCSYAHSLEQLQPRRCNYDSRCINERCMFIHSKENKDSFIKRIENIVKIPPSKKKVRRKAHIIKTTMANAEEDFLIALKIGCKYYTVMIMDEEK